MYLDQSESYLFRAIAFARHHVDLASRQCLLTPTHEDFCGVRFFLTQRQHTTAPSGVRDSARGTNHGRGTISAAMSCRDCDEPGSQSYEMLIRSWSHTTPSKVSETRASLPRQVNTTEGLRKLSSSKTTSSCPSYRSEAEARLKAELTLGMPSSSALGKVLGRCAVSFPTDTRPTQATTSCPPKRIACPMHRLSVNNKPFSIDKGACGSGGRLC